MTPPRTLAGVHRRIAACTVCPKLTPHTKFSARASGTPETGCMIVGEAPGAASAGNDLHWSGRGGMLLRTEMRALGYELEDVFYLTNIIKCCPPRNRDPSRKEVAACEDFLRTELDLVQPELLITFGRFAARYFLGDAVEMARIHGRRRRYGPRSEIAPSADAETTLVTMYHPANINLHEDVTRYKKRVRRIFAEALRVAGRPPVT